MDATKKKKKLAIEDNVERNNVLVAHNCFLARTASKIVPNAPKISKTLVNIGKLLQLAVEESVKIERVGFLIGNVLALGITSKVFTPCLMILPEMQGTWCVDYSWLYCVGHAHWQ
jgi:hypothetical protein